MFSLTSKKSYKVTRENIDYLFNMNRKERAIFRLKKLIDSELENIDFTDLRNRAIIISFSVCIALITSKYPAFAAGTGVEWADNIGNTFLHYAQAVGAWACVIKAILTLIQAVIQDTVGSCWKNIIGYAVAGLAIYKLPNVLFSLR